VEVDAVDVVVVVVPLTIVRGPVLLGFQLWKFSGC